jgi:CDGSH-type Zn-finger protein
MADPKHCTAPMPIEETPGKKAYCTCGWSAKLPYCDGSHNRMDTGCSRSCAKSPSRPRSGCASATRAPPCPGVTARTRSYANPDLAPRREANPCAAVAPSSRRRASRCGASPRSAASRPPAPPASRRALRQNARRPARSPPARCCTCCKPAGHPAARGRRPLQELTLEPHERPQLLRRQSQPAPPAAGQSPRCSSRHVDERRVERR